MSNDLSGIVNAKSTAIFSPERSGVGYRAVLPKKGIQSSGGTIPIVFHDLSGTVNVIGIVSPKSSQVSYRAVLPKEGITIPIEANDLTGIVDSFCVSINPQIADRAILPKNSFIIS